MKVKKKLLIPILSFGLIFGYSSVSNASSINQDVNKLTATDLNKYNKPTYENRDYSKDSWRTETEWDNYVKSGQQWDGLSTDTKKNTILIHNKNKIEIQKKDENGNNLGKGFDFTAYRSLDNGKTFEERVNTYTTDSNGKITINLIDDDLLYGFFQIKETGVPVGGSGYNVDKNNVMTFYHDSGVRFLGEMKVNNLKINGKVNQNLNTYLQTNTKGYNGSSIGINFGDTSVINQNWLVFNDNGKELLIPKKPLKHSISWNELYNAGVVYSKDVLDEDPELKRADFTHDNYSSKPALNDHHRGRGTKKSYSPKKIKINGKEYYVRLIKAYNDIIGVNEYSNSLIKYVKDSEWNRLILPLIGINGKEDTIKNSDDYANSPYGRFGYYTRNYVEKNMPTLANYSWWQDFAGNSNSDGKYKIGDYYGIYHWTQNAYDASHRPNRGGRYANYGAANSYGIIPNDTSVNRGWFPVLEEAEGPTLNKILVFTLDRIEGDAMTLVSSHNIDKVLVKTYSGEEIEATIQKKEKETYEISLGRSLSAGERVIIEIVVNGEISKPIRTRV